MTDELSLWRLKAELPQVTLRSTIVGLVIGYGQ